MLQVEVCLTPGLIHLHDLSEKVIVITDILRATSSITYGLQNGAEAIIPVSTINECAAYKRQGYYIAAERNGRVVEGFDFGNSPFSYTAELVGGKTIALTTTNGTKAINLSYRPDNTIIAGSFLNIGAVCSYIRRQQKGAVVVCSGWKDQFNMEDTLFAGAVAAGLQPEYTVAEDAAQAALHLYRQAQDDLYDFLKNCSHPRRLQKLNITEDIKFCLQRDVCTALPLLQDGRLININK